MFDDSIRTFHPVVKFKREPVVFDFTETYDPNALAETPWGIGRYDEHRAHAMYDAPLYPDDRRIHMGIDLWAPPGTPVYAFADGTVMALADNDNRRDYGPTLVTEHVVDGIRFWVLLGHLTRATLQRWQPGDAFAEGDVLAHVGTEAENGHWSPHVHVQISRTRPDGADMPGVVRPADRAEARATYPDPRCILGPLYTDDPTPTSAS